MALTVPERLAANCRTAPGRAAWLARLPAVVREMEDRWSLTLGAPFDGEEGGCAWVAPVARADGTPAVLKLGMPHMEGEHEIQGLRFWDGDPTVRLLEADDDLGAMLIERCEPGTSLRDLPEQEQDRVIAGLLRRLWRPSPAPHPFRPLSALTAYWSRETLADAASWPDAGLVREGLRLFQELPRSASTEVLLATDLHAGNVLRAQREPWLVIDPKPFVGDPAYDATRHLFNCRARLRADPDGTIRRFAELLELNRERVRLWTFARAAAEPREEWKDGSIGGEAFHPCATFAVEIHSCRLEPAARDARGPRGADSQAAEIRPRPVALNRVGRQGCRSPRTPAAARPSGDRAVGSAFHAPAHLGSSHSEKAPAESSPRLRPS